MTFSPIPGSGSVPPTGLPPVPHGGAKVAAVGKAAARLPIDRNMAGLVQHALPAAAVSLEDIRISIDKLDDNSDLLYTAKEADRMRGHGQAGLGKAGLAVAILNIFVSVNSLVKSLTATPIPLDRVIASLVGIGVNMGEFVGKGFVAGLAGVSNAVQGFLGTVDALERVKEEGANPSNVLEALSYATQSLGGLAQALAVAFPPLAGVLAPVSVGLYMASGALTLAQFAYDQREWIKDKATKPWGAISSVYSSSPAPAEGPPRASPRRALS